jgi:hypothetical protein
MIDGEIPFSLALSAVFIPDELHNTIEGHFHIISQPIILVTQIVLDSLILFLFSDQILDLP